METFRHINAVTRAVGWCTTIPPATPPLRSPTSMTRAIVEVARPLGISVHDHLIVDKDGHASLKALKLM